MFEKSKIKWYGIFDTCCKVRDNIKIIGMNSDIGQCQECKRIFKQ